MGLELGTITGTIDLKDQFTAELEKSLGITASALGEVRTEMTQAVAKGKEVDENLKKLGVSYDEYFAALKKTQTAQAEANAQTAISAHATDEWTEANQRAALRMERLHATALQMNEDMTKTSFQATRMAGDIREAGQTFDELAKTAGFSTSAMAVIGPVSNVAQTGMVGLTTAVVGFNAATFGVVTAGFALGHMLGSWIGQFESVQHAIDATLHPLAQMVGLVGQVNTEATKGLAGFQKEMGEKNVEAIEKQIASMKALGQTNKEIADFYKGTLTPELMRKFELTDKDIKGQHEAAEAAKKYDEALVSAMERVGTAMDKHHQEMARVILDWDKTKRAADEAANATGFVMPPLPELPKDMGIGSTGTAGLAGANAAKMFAQGFSAETVFKNLTSKNLSDSLRLSPQEAEAIMASLHHHLGEKSFGQTLSDSLSAGLAKLPDVIVGAIQGGGDIGKAVGASLGGDLGKGVGETIAKNIGGTLGKTLGNFAGPIGSILGSIAGAGLDKLTSALGIGGNKVIMQVNDMRDAFLDAQGGFVELQKKLVGLTDQDIVKKIFDARTVEDFNAAVNEVNSLLQTQEDAQAALNDAVERYGFTIEELGPKFAQQKMDEQAMQLIQDFEILKASGIDVNTIIEHMGPALNEFVQQSIAAGTAIPEAMRPVIEQMIAQGQLLDENGNAYASVEDAGITFAQTMDEKFTTLIDKITQMVNALLGIPTDVNTNVNVNTNYSSSGDQGGQARDHGFNFPGEHNAMGGIVTSPTISALGERGPEVITPLSELAGLTAPQGPSMAELSPGAVRGITKSIRDALLQART